MQHRLPPHADGVARRRGSRERHADRGRHLSRRRTHRAVAGIAQPHPHDHVQRGALPPPAGGDRGGLRLPAGGEPAAGLQPAADGGAPPAGRPGPRLRAGRGVADPGASDEAVPDHDRPRPPRRGVHAHRRPSRPERRHLRAGEGSARPRLRDPHSHGSHRHHRAQRPGRGGRLESGDHPHPGRGQRGWHLVVARRPARGRDDPSRRGGAPVRGHHALRRGPEPARGARPRPPGVLPRGGRRPGRGRIRAQPRSLGPGRHPARLQPAAAGPQLGPVRAPGAQRHGARAGP